MAEGMDVGEFWLPSEFLDADFFLEGEANSRRGERRTPGACELGSNLGSPSESESDEEDYLAGLTRQMARAFLQDDEVPSALPPGYPKVKAMAGSPQSTLCDLGIWTSSRKASPNGHWQVSSQPSTHFEQHMNDARDLLTAAAKQAVRLSLSDQAWEEQQQFHGRGLLRPPAKRSLPIPAPHKGTGSYVSPLLAQQQLLQAERFYQLKQQQLMKQQMSAAWGRQQSRGGKAVGGGGVYGEGRCERLLGQPSSAWPPLQRQQQQQSQPGSGMRAVFLTGSGRRRESAGTGVFLPRRPGNPTVQRKKPACSTVLLPDRVIQALSLNINDTGAPHPRLPGGFALDHDAMVARGNDQKRRNQYHPSPPAVTNREHPRLPAEWTY